MCCRRTVAMTVVRSLCAGPPRLRGGFVVCFVVSNDQVAELEYEVARTAIAHRQQVSRAEPVEHRNADPEERDAETLGALAAVRMRDEEIAALLFREVLEILEIADV